MNMQVKVTGNQTKLLGMKCIMLLVLLLSLSGCSTKFIYNYADWFIFWKLDDYVELTDPQQTLVEAKVTELLQWHRTQELPYYSSLLKRLRKVVITKEQTDLETLFAEAKLIWQRAAVKVTPELIELLPLLSKEQQRELVENIKSTQQERNDKWQNDSEESIESRFEQIQEKIENYTGDLTKDQQKTLFAIEQQRPNIIPLRIEGRDKWLSLFSQALFNQTNIDNELLYKLFTDLPTHRSKEQQLQMDKMSALTLSKAKYLLESMTAKQQSELLTKIDELTTDLDLLATQT